MALKLQMENITRSTTVPWYDVKMRKMLELSTEAHGWLTKREPKHWSRAYFKTTTKCDMLTSVKPSTRAYWMQMTSSVDYLRRIILYIMLLMTNRRVACEKWHGQIGLIITKTLEKTKEKA